MAEPFPFIFWHSSNSLDRESYWVPTHHADWRAAFIYLFLFLFTKNTIGYLREITTGMQEFADGDLSYTIPVSSADELGTLAKNMNTMADKLRLSLEEERASAKAKNDLITGVSHDLRTPLTSVIGFWNILKPTAIGMKLSCAIM